MMVSVTVYPFGQPLTTEHDNLETVFEAIKGFVSLHQPGSSVDVTLAITA